MSEKLNEHKSNGSKVPNFPQTREEMNALSPAEIDLLREQVRARQQHLMEQSRVRYKRPFSLFGLRWGFGASRNHYPKDFYKNPFQIDSENLARDGELVAGDMWLGILGYERSNRK